MYSRINIHVMRSIHAFLQKFILAAKVLLIVTSPKTTSFTLTIHVLEIHMTTK